MSFAKYGLAEQSSELGKGVLVLGTLGVFTKLLNIDLSKLHVLGITLRPAESGLLPGFLGLALVYTYVAFCVARAEAAMEHVTDKESIEVTKRVLDSKVLMRFTWIVAPFAGFVYSMPYVVGGLGIVLLWRDSIAVLRSIWQLIV